MVANDPILTSPSPSVTWIRKSMSPSPSGLDMLWYWKNSHLPVAGVNSRRNTKVSSLALPIRVLADSMLVVISLPVAVVRPVSLEPSNCM
ncbi:hypothetical protein D3C86_1699950 [compost metagenome]